MHKITTAAALAGCVVGAYSASAHVTVQPNEASAGAYFQMAFTVGHGCDGSATTALRIKVPDGVVSVKPQMKPGWTVEIKTRKLDAPQPAMHGKALTETVDEVAWRGGPLPDNLFDAFGLMMKLPNMPGQIVYFPLVQECEQGVHRWIEIPVAGQSADKLREPAPFVRLKPGAP